LQQYPAFPKALTLCAVIQLNDKQWGAAEQNLQAAVRDPAYPPAYVVLGDPYNKEVRFDGALAMTERPSRLFLVVALAGKWRGPEERIFQWQRSWAFSVGSLQAIALRSCGMHSSSLGSLANRTASHWITSAISSTGKPWTQRLGRAIFLRFPLTAHQSKISCRVPEST
jgi:hypothetical protein